MGNRTKTIVVAASTVAMLATPAAASEPGATFYEDGSCNEADGTRGLSQPDGDCLTIADYDALFSFENLSTVPSAIDPSVSIAAEAGLVNDDVPASQRELGDGVTPVPHRFVDHFAWANGLPIRLA